MDLYTISGSGLLWPTKDALDLKKKLEHHAGMAQALDLVPSILDIKFPIQAPKQSFILYCESTHSNEYWSFLRRHVDSGSFKVSSTLYLSLSVYASGDDRLGKLSETISEYPHPEINPEWFKYALSNVYRATHRLSSLIDAWKDRIGQFFPSDKFLPATTLQAGKLTPSGYTCTPVLSKEEFVSDVVKLEDWGVQLHRSHKPFDPEEHVHMVRYSKNGKPVGYYFFDLYHNSVGWLFTDRSVPELVQEVETLRQEEAFAYRLLEDLAQS